MGEVLRSALLTIQPSSPLEVVPDSPPASPNHVPFTRVPASSCSRRLGGSRVPGSRISLQASAEPVQGFIASAEPLATQPATSREPCPRRPPESRPCLESRPEAAKVFRGEKAVRCSEHLLTAFPTCLSVQFCSGRLLSRSLLSSSELRLQTVPGQELRLYPFHPCFRGHPAR